MPFSSSSYQEHGGAGFTLAWGCAMELGEILKEHK
jgi:hypothetical protein|tara:strand:- start:942 stop:1046 length:105 start_codon:yes stop_codon:yes gene_type:complete